jgi:hypothetical protein
MITKTETDPAESRPTKHETHFEAKTLKTTQNVKKNN